MQRFVSLLLIFSLGGGQIPAPGEQKKKKRTLKTAFLYFLCCLVFKQEKLGRMSSESGGSQGVKKEKLKGGKAAAEQGDWFNYFWPLLSPDCHGNKEGHGNCSVNTHTQMCNDVGVWDKHLWSEEVSSCLCQDKLNTSSLSGLKWCFLGRWVYF